MPATTPSTPEPPAEITEADTEFYKYFLGVPKCKCPRIDFYERSQYGFRERCKACTSLGCPYTEADEDFDITMSLTDSKCSIEYQCKKAQVVQRRLPIMEKIWGIEYLGSTKDGSVQKGTAPCKGLKGRKEQKKLKVHPYSSGSGSTSTQVQNK